MGTQGTGRKRSTKKERSTAEDDALNLIAREAEARLAAKRAARAEAREIRMKELERQQKEIFQVQKKYYGLDTKLDDRGDSKWGDIEQWMEDSERYSRSSRIHTLSDDDERMSVGSRGSVRSDLDAVGAYGGGGSSSHKKSKKKKKHKHKDKDRNGYDDDYSLISSRSSRLSDESRASRSSRLDLTSSRLSDDSRLSRASRLDLQPASFASSDFGFNGLSSSRNPGSAFNGYQSSLYEDSLCSGSRRAAGSTSLPLDYTSYRSSGSRASSRASSARASPVDNCGSVASFLRSAAGSSGLPRDLDDVTIPDFSDVEDRDYLEKGSRAASALTAGTLTSLGGTSSRRGSGETALTLDAETSIREIKEIHELKDQIQDVETKYTQNLKEAKDALAVAEEKYRKAMVSNAQLDNEKNNLMYQVDTLKDSLMELEEMLAESQRSYEEKVKEHEREKHAHSVLQFQFNEMKEMLKQSEELLNEIRQLRLKQEGFVREISDLQETVEWKDKKIGALERQKEYTDAIRIERDELREEVVNLKDILKKHGIVLGPDLNINGDVGETDVDGSPGADPASQPAPDSQTSPTEGNSVLGNAEASQLRSSREEEVDPEQHQEMFEEAKVNHSGSDPLCNVVSTLETPPEEPREEQQTCLATEDDTVKESVLSKDLNVDIIDSPDTEAKDVIICSPELQATVTRSGENVSETKTPEGGDLVEIETKTDGVDTPRDDIRESCNNVSEEKANKEECVEGSRLINTESCHQQTVAQDVKKESSPDESARDSADVELQQEPENAEEAENDEAEEASSKSQPQGASGKKKRKKRKGKKKGGTQVDKNQHKDGADTEKRQKSDKKIESAAKDNGPTTDPDINGSVTESIKDSNVDQVENEPNREETEEVGGVKAVEPTEISSHVETVKESVVDRDMDEQNKEPRLESETVEAAEAVSPTETSSHVETFKESRTDPEKDEQDEEQTLDKAEEAGSITSAVPEINIIPPDPSDPEGAEDPDGLDPVCTSGVDNSKSETDISTDANVVDTQSEIVDSEEDEARLVKCTTSDPESTFETNEENTDVQNDNDVAADESESTPGSRPSADLESLSASELPSAAVNLGDDDAPVEVCDQVKDPAKETGAVEEDEQLKAEIEQESFAPGPDGDKTKVKPDGTENKDTNGDLRKPEGLVEPDCSSQEEKGNGGLLHHDEKDVLETSAQLEEEESQTIQHNDQIDHSCAETSSETEEINTSGKSNAADSPNGANETGSTAEQDPGPEESAEAEDPEPQNRPNDPQTETSETRNDEPEDDDNDENDASQPPLLASDKGDEEDDEEGQSFDFDDMDVEAAVATDLTESPKQTEVEEGVEVKSDDSNLCGSNETDLNENTQPERVENSDENQADAPDKETGTHHDKGASENEERQNDTPEEDEPRHIIEEGKALIVGAFGAVADKINQAMSAPVEEGLDAAKQELQGDDSVSPKSAGQEGGGKEPAPSGKDVRKNSKKGKAKGKEDCKMS